MEHYINLFIRNVFVDNILLTYFLGMCSFLACSRQMQTSIGLGIAVIFITAVTTPLNWLIKHYVLGKGALAWAGLPGVDLSFLIFIVFIAAIAAVTQMIEMVIDRYSPALYAALGIFLPLIVANCAVLGSSFFMDQRGYTFAESLVFGCASGTGWAVAIVLLSAIRKKLWYSNVPGPLRGLGIAMIATGFMAMAFMVFAGLRF
ncbi:MAG: NADH:ubiquinone reductase (Na(+)-transporting) subunit E [Candidatus Omnitrophica bacterium]|nr:NADH:ubiquinone reductase (Na(+)-transporting) subunit E [Candidatus Omnitrophota bacterium]